MEIPAPIPPHNLEAERAVLGGALLDPATAQLVAATDASIYYKEAHRHVAAAISALVRRGEPVDTLQVSLELGRLGTSEAAGGAAGLALLLEQGSIAVHGPKYLNAVREYAGRREAIAVGTALTLNAFDEAGPPVDALVGDAIGRLLRLQGGSVELITGAALFGDTEGVKSEPIPTNVAVLDEATDGLTPGHLTVIAGRPGMGKTALAVEITHRLVRVERVPTAFLSLEMPAAEITARMLSLETGVNSRLIMRRQESDPQRMRSARAMLATAPLHIQRAPVRQLADVLGLMRTAVTRHGARVLVVDHLGRIQGRHRGANSKYADVSETVEELKSAALQLDVPVVLLCQLNRSIESRDGEDARPRLSDLRDTGRIEEEADEILFIWTTADRHDGCDPLPVLLTLAKDRNGVTWDRPYLFHRSRGRFEAEAIRPEPRRPGHSYEPDWVRGGA